MSHPLLKLLFDVLVDCCAELGGEFSLGTAGGSKLVSCGDIFLVLRPGAQILFTFAQMYFIFLSHKLPVFRRRLAARLGLAHLAATNLALWLRAVVAESRSQLGAVPGTVGDNSSEVWAVWSNQSEGAGLEVGPGACEDRAAIRLLARHAAPYLYPCTVQYSLLCCLVVLAMWRRVGAEYGAGRGRGGPGRGCRRYSLDCSGSHAGLFSAVTLLTLALVALVLVLVFTGSHDPTLRSLATPLQVYTGLAVYW